MASNTAVNQAKTLIKDARKAKSYGGVLSSALEFAEMFEQPDPWIRTKVRTAPGGSSAYGPNQITKKLAVEFKNKRSDIFDRKELDYLDRFVKQGTLFLRYGNEPNKPGFESKYDYGGKGDLDTPKDRKLYHQVATKMLDYYHDKYEGDVGKILTAWRFGESIVEKEGPSKAFQKDPRYLKLFSVILNYAAGR